VTTHDVHLCQYLMMRLIIIYFSWCLQALVHWCGFHAARGESEWCILLWCLAAQTVAARHLSSCWRLLLSSTPRVRKSTELLWHKTPDFTPDVAFQQTRPQFCRLLRLLRVVQECVCQKQQGMSNIVDELWLLTEWYFIKRMTYYISQRRVEAPIRIGGQLCHNYVANLLTICMPKIIENIMQLNKVIAN